MGTINPYIAGNQVGGTNAFVGREDVQQDVMAVLRNPNTNAIVLYGQRRIGKTSILHQLLARLKNQEKSFYPVYFDLQDRAGLTVSEVVEHLANTIVRELCLPKPDLGKEPEVSFHNAWLPQTLQAIAKEQKILVLLFDEFDVLADPKGGQAARDFFPYLRRLLELSRERLKFIFVIGRNMGEMRADALSVFKAVIAKKISLLERKDAEAIILLSERNGSLKWTTEAVDQVWALTHGHPMFTQALCFRVWENKHEDEAEAVPVVIAQDVEGAVQETLQDTQNAFDWLWDGLNPAQKVIATALAHAGKSSVGADELEQILVTSGVRIMIRELTDDAPELLQQWDIIESIRDGFQFKVELFRLWIQQNKSLNRVRQELDRIQPIAESLYQAARVYYDSKNFDQAKARLSEALGLNPQHTGANQLLAELLIAQGDFDEAQKLLESLMDYAPEVAKRRLIQVYWNQAQQAKNDDEQLAFYDKILKISPNHNEAAAKKKQIWSRRGDQRLEKGDFEGARGAFVLSEEKEKLALVTQKVVESKVAEVQKLRGEKKYKESSNLLKDLLNMAPESMAAGIKDLIAEVGKDARIHKTYRDGVKAIEQGHMEKGQQLLAKVIAENPKYEEASRYLHWAVTGKDPNQVDSMEEYFRKRVEQSKTSPESDLPPLTFSSDKEALDQGEVDAILKRYREDLQRRADARAKSEKPSAPISPVTTTRNKAELAETLQQIQDAIDRQQASKQAINDRLAAVSTPKSAEETTVKPDLGEAPLESSQAAAVPAKTDAVAKPSARPRASRSSAAAKPKKAAEEPAPYSPPVVSRVIAAVLVMAPFTTWIMAMFLGFMPVHQDSIFQPYGYLWLIIFLLVALSCISTHEGTFIAASLCLILLIRNSSIASPQSQIVQLAVVLMLVFTQTLYGHSPWTSLAVSLGLASFLAFGGAGEPGILLAVIAIGYLFSPGERWISLGVLVAGALLTWAMYGATHTWFASSWVISIVVSIALLAGFGLTSEHFTQKRAFHIRTTVVFGALSFVGIAAAIWAIFLSGN